MNERKTGVEGQVFPTREQHEQRLKGRKDRARVLSPVCEETGSGLRLKGEQGPDAPSMWALLGILGLIFRAEHPLKDLI